MTEQDLRSLVRGTLVDLLSEADRNAVARDVLAVAADVFRKGTGDKGELRLQPVDKTVKMSSDDVRDILRRSGHPVAREVPPGQVGSKSGKFTTYWTRTGVPIVVAGGSNRGQELERQIQQADLSSKELDELKAAIGLRDVVGIEPGKSNARRPLGLRAHDVGAIVADVILRLADGSRAFVSLKDPNGATFGNFGIVGSFVENKEGQIEPRPHPSDVVLTALGIDKQLIADGLNDLVSGLGSELVDDAPEYDPERVRGILESGYGYGYFYARKRSKGWDVVDLNTVEALSEHVGDVTVERVKYPGKDKQCAAWLSTSTGGRYKIEIRNTKGGILPREIKVKVLKGMDLDGRS